MSRQSRRYVAIPLFLFLIVVTAACGGSSGDSNSSSSTSAIKHWNSVAVDTSGRDHEATGAKEQVGPVRSARAMAIVHIAVGDAVAAISGEFRGYLPVDPIPANTSQNAAVAQAAHDTLVSLFPSQTSIIDDELTSSLSEEPDSEASANGVELGKRTAAAILEIRAEDGSQFSEPIAPINYTPKQDVGKWRPDPINPAQKAIGAQWYRVIPFVMASASQFRVPPPPALTSAEYTAAYNEVKRLGGDGVTTPTERTDEQTVTGIFWAYDGTPSLCAPPRLYNQISVKIADDHGLNEVELARLLSLVNVAMADAGIAIWESKYHYEFWRPVTGIRESDGNSDTVGDPTYVPLCSPASNLAGPNFTPPFPSYPSGHAGFGGALFETLRNFFGTDDISFSFTSDEFNGVTKGATGNVRPRIQRYYASLSEAEEENGQSRIYLGIHWSFDKTQGIAQGRQVADLVFENAFTPLP